MPRHSVDVAAAFGVGERRLGVAVGLEPVRRAAVERRDERGLGLAQLSCKQITQQRVTAVCLAVPVERGDEQVPALERRQDAARVLLLQHGVADRGGQALEHRRPPEERPQLVRQRGEKLGAGSTPPGTGRRRPAGHGRVRRCSPAASTLRRIPAAQPSHRSTSSAASSSRETRVEAVQERLALAAAQRQVGGTQLEQAPVRAKTRDRQATGPGVPPASASIPPGRARPASRAPSSPCASEATAPRRPRARSPERAQPGREPPQLGRPILRPASRCERQAHRPGGCARAPPRAG